MEFYRKFRACPKEMLLLDTDVNNRAPDVVPTVRTQGHASFFLCFSLCARIDFCRSDEKKKQKTECPVHKVCVSPPCRRLHATLPEAPSKAHFRRLDCCMQHFEQISICRPSKASLQAKQTGSCDRDRDRATATALKPDPTTKFLRSAYVYMYYRRPTPHAHTRRRRFMKSKTC